MAPAVHPLQDWTQDPSEDPQGPSPNEPETCSKLISSCLVTTSTITLAIGFVLGIVGTLYLWLMFATVSRCRFVTHSEVSSAYQWASVIEDAIESSWQQMWSFFTLMLVFGKSMTHRLLPFNVGVVIFDIAYRIAIQAIFPAFYGSSLRSIPLNIISLAIIFLNSAFVSKKVNGSRVEIPLTMCLALPPILAVLAAYLFKYLLLPVYSGIEDPNLGALFIILAPIPFFLGNFIVRACIQYAQRKSEHFKNGFVLCSAMLNSGAFILRTIQAETSSLVTMTVIGLYYGTIELVQRSTIEIRDRFISRIMRRKRDICDNKKELMIDIIITGMLAEAISIVFANGAVFSITYMNGDIKKQFVQFLQHVAIQLSIEWFFDLMSIIIESRVQKLPIIQFWRDKWRIYIVSMLLIYSVATFQLQETFASFIQLTLGGGTVPECPFK